MLAHNFAFYHLENMGSCLCLCSFATVSIELCRENFGMARKENTKAKEKKRERKLMEMKMNLG